MIELMDKENMDAAFVASTLLAQAGIPYRPGEGATLGDQYEITSFKIDVNHAIIVNHGFEYKLKMVGLKVDTLEEAHAEVLSLRGSLLFACDEAENLPPKADAHYSAAMAYLQLAICELKHANCSRILEQ